MLVIAIYKMSNVSRWYPVAKSHQDHQGSQREQLRNWWPFKASFVSPATSAGMWFDSRLRHNAFR